MQPRLDDANIEFDFTLSEKIAARSLDPVKIAWLQTKYAQLWKKRASLPASEGAETDRSYFLAVAELDGKLGMLQELLDDHKTAMHELSDRPNEEVAEKDVASTTARAAQLVHRIPTS